MCSFRAWQADRYERLSSNQHERGLRVAMHRLRFDASRTNIYKRSKLQVTEVTSTFVLRPVSDEVVPWERIESRKETKRMLGTLLRCRHGKADATLAMIEKQFGSLRAPHWLGDGSVGHKGLLPKLLTSDLMALTDKTANAMLAIDGCGEDIIEDMSASSATAATDLATIGPDVSLFPSLDLAQVAHTHSLKLNANNS